MRDTGSMVLLSTHSNARILSEPKLEGDPEITYFPSTTDKMWDIEVGLAFIEIELPALDVCCGTRSPLRGMWRVDNRENSHPNVLADCNHLPFCDETFETVYLGHGLEHLNNTRGAIKDLLRVIKKGGSLLIIHPDYEFTATMDKTHKNEYTIDEFRQFLVNNLDLGYYIKTVMPACPHWSFFVHLVKL